MGCGKFVSLWTLGCAFVWKRPGKNQQIACFGGGYRHRASKVVPSEGRTEAHSVLDRCKPVYAGCSEVIGRRSRDFSLYHQIEWQLGCVNKRRQFPRGTHIIAVGAKLSSQSARQPDWQNRIVLYDQAACIPCFPQSECFPRRNTRRWPTIRLTNIGTTMGQIIRRLGVKNQVNATLVVALQPVTVTGIHLGRGISKFYLSDKTGACDDWRVASNRGATDVAALVTEYCRE